MQVGRTDASGMDRCRCRWGVVDEWINADGCRWIEMERYGYRWIEMDTDGCRWMQTIHTLQIDATDSAGPNTDGHRREPRPSPARLSADDPARLPGEPRPPADARPASAAAAGSLPGRLGRGAGRVRGRRAEAGRRRQRTTYSRAA
jgi:hypothetical protein